MFSTFRARISEHFVKMNYSFFPSPTTHAEALFHNRKKRFMKAWQILRAQRCGGTSWVKRRAWVGLLNRSPLTYVGQSPGKQSPSFWICSLPALCPPQSLSALCPLPLEPHIFFPSTQEVSLSVLSGFLWIDLREMMGKEKFDVGGRLWKSCPWRRHLQDHRTLTWPPLTSSWWSRKTSLGRRCLNKDVKEVREQVRERNILGRWNTRRIILSQVDTWRAWSVAEMEKERGEKWQSERWMRNTGG